jgi:hypothetical protein
MQGQGRANLLSSSSGLSFCLGTSSQMRRASAAHGFAANEMMQVIEIVGKKKPRFFLSAICVCHRGHTQSFPYDGQSD